MQCSRLVTRAGSVSEWVRSSDCFNSILTDKETGAGSQQTASECPDVKNYKWQYNPRMLYSCTYNDNSGRRRFMTSDASIALPCPATFQSLVVSSANTSGFRQHRVGRSSGLLGSPTPVCAECGCSTDVSIGADFQKFQWVQAPIPSISTFLSDLLPFPSSLFHFPLRSSLFFIPPPLRSPFLRSWTPQNPAKGFAGVL